MAIPAEKKPTLLLGIRYAERKEHAPPGLVWRKAIKGETLGTIADDYDIRWIDIALYNWHTARPLEINWYLHHFVGCTVNNGKTYSFSGSEKTDSRIDPEGGWLLVPNIPPSLKKGPRRPVAVVRNGSATRDIRLQVQVVEWLAGGNTVAVSGKWLYVFSGNDGVGFGYDPPPSPPGIDGPKKDQPGTAFTHDFPGVFPIKERPTELVYEILVTAENAPSQGLMTALSHLGYEGEPYYKPGANWYFLSGDILSNALTEGRDKRTTHAFRNTKLIDLDLKGNKRFYFLLSPVQLGPEALKYAMANPKGLTPLLKPHENEPQWNPSNPSGPLLDQYIGPAADDMKKGVITLPVIDPYAWPENVAEYGYQDSLEQYVKWLGINSKSSGQNETTEKLIAETGWTLDHLYVAQILKSVRDNHPDPGSIDDVLTDAAKWKKDLEKWDKELTQRNAEINASVHRSLVQLTDWLQGPGHTIIETAILKDANANSFQDAVDVARAILHWNVCTENMIALEPGVAYLRQLFSKPGSVPTDVILQSLDLDKATLKITETNQTAFQLSLHGLFGMLSLNTFLSAPPKISSNGTRKDYLIKLGDYLKARRDKLIKLLNDSNITPAKLHVPALKPTQAPTGGLLVAATTVNSFLDAADKITNIVITRKARLDGAASLDEWFRSRKGSKLASLSISYSLKGLALILNGYNLYSAITTARYDYQTNQMTVSKLSYLQNISGMTAAVQDVLAEVANLAESEGLKRIFPQIMTAGGSTWFEAASIAGIAGRTFATVNVITMLIAGATTAISMAQNFLAARDRGDYTAAGFYMAGHIGGLAMVGGGLCFGVALMEASGLFIGTGIFATIGVILFTVGGIIAAVASFLAWLTTSDEYQIYARKCFLGKQGDEEPRFGKSPEVWSNASVNGGNTWPIDKQKRAILNLLGRFNVTTKLQDQTTYARTILYDITLGLFRPRSAIEVALHYSGKGAPQTAATFVWDPDEPPQGHRPVNLVRNGLFDPEQTDIRFSYKGDQVSSIKITVPAVQYDSDYGKLMTTVTLQYHDLPNKIRALKRVMEGFGSDLEVDTVEVTSGIFK